MHGEARDVESGGTDVLQFYPLRIVRARVVIIHFVDAQRGKVLAGDHTDEGGRSGARRAAVDGEREVEGFRRLIIRIVVQDHVEGLQIRVGIRGQEGELQGAYRAVVGTTRGGAREQVGDIHHHGTGRSDVHFEADGHGHAAFRCGRGGRDEADDGLDRGSGAHARRAPHVVGRVRVPVIAGRTGHIGSALHVVAIDHAIVEQAADREVAEGERLVRHGDVHHRVVVEGPDDVLAHARIQGRSAVHVVGDVHH